MKTVCFPVIAFVLLALSAPPLEAQNPNMILDINAGSASAFLSAGVSFSRDVVNGNLYFSANNATYGQEIWLCAPPFDAAATKLLKDMTPGTAGTSVKYHAAYDKLFFISPAAIDKNGWYQGLCRSDGTTPGTMLLYAPAVVKNIAHYIREMTSSQGAIFFSGYTTRVGNPVLDYTGFFRKSDPVSGASITLKTGGNFQSLTAVNGTIVCFEWNFPYDKGLCRLYRSNGTSKGTVTYYNMPLDGIDSPNMYPASPHPYYAHKTFCVGGNNLFFQFNDAAGGSELWKTDGTAAGTRRVTDINPGPGHGSPAMGAVMNGYLYFSANDGTHGWQIWRYPVSGTGAAERVTNIDGGAAGADPMWLTAVNGTLFFSAYTPDDGRELWKSNGLPLTDPATLTTIVTNINIGAASSNPRYATSSYATITTTDSDGKYKFSMASIGNWVYFPADDGLGYALWRSDGTVAEKLGAVNPQRLTPVSWLENDVQHDMLLFIAWTEAAGYELWKYDPALPASPKRAGDGIPAGLALSRNYPNPFNPSTLIRYEIPEAGYVRLLVHDMHGRTVATLVEGERPAGASSVRFDGGLLPSGMYTYTLECGGAMLSRVMCLVK